MNELNGDAMYIGYDEIPKVLLIGNGFNRAYKFASWDELIRKIQTKELTKDEEASLQRIPYPMQPVILTGDHLGTQMRHISGELSALKAPEEEGALLREYAALPVDAVLTANYSYEFEKALAADFKCLPGRKCRYRKVAYAEGGEYNTRQLHTYYTPRKTPVWHIHGEAARPDTMVLGHYYYGKLLAKMQQYVSGLIARQKAGTAKQQPIEMRSWIDYFLLGEVHIVGLGMSLSEMDLWWLVNCKKRHFPDRKIVLYKPQIGLEERLLAETYGVIVNRDGYDGDYRVYYHTLCKRLRETL